MPFTTTHVEVLKKPKKKADAVAPGSAVKNAAKAALAPTKARSTLKVRRLDVDSTKPGSAVVLSADEAVKMVTRAGILTPGGKLSSRYR